MRARAKTARRIGLDYLEQRTQAALMGLAYDELAKELVTRGANTAHMRRFVELMETFDYEAFSGVVSGIGFEQQLDDLAGLLKALNEEVTG